MGYKMKKTLNLICSLFISIFIITSIIKLTINFKQLYYFDIDFLNIPKLSDMTKKDIKLNYEYLIEYNTKSSESDFKLPTLKSSAQGKIHFEEVRDIFQHINKINFITLIISILGVYISVKTKDIGILKYSGIVLIIMPIVLITPILMNFQSSFEVFHKILFDNDYWIFDPNLDPVINILPSEFFFHSGVLILMLILVFSLLMIFSYKRLKKRSSI
jgi:integral membrane protein (TIGR01906 family)